LRFNDAMRGGTIFILLGITAAVAYSVGHTDAPATSPPAAVATAPTAKPVALIPAPAPAQAPSSPTPSKADSPDKPARPDAKRKVEV
jgi:hypothetical protein